jgi:hypothetical protein
MRLEPETKQCLVEMKMAIDEPGQEQRAVKIKVGINEGCTVGWLDG